jgi:nucleotide-binding universal stress UspA family protein
MSSGNVAAALLSLLQKESYDLVVMTTHGCAGNTRWAPGSVAERLVGASHTPILMPRSITTSE